MPVRVADTSGPRQVWRRSPRRNLGPVTVRLSSTLTQLPRYVPGRSVPGAIKLASNETPYPPLPSVLERIAESAQRVNRYPDTGSGELTNRIAARLGVDPAQVAVGSGSVALCAQLVLATCDPGSEVVYAWRSFEAYPMVVALASAQPVPVPLVDFAHDLDAMAAAVTERTRLIFVCNPNNPTGTVVEREALLAFLERVPSDVVVALDEAYFEFVRDGEVPDGVTLLALYPNLVVLRTFSKAYGLAGLRVGYAVAGDPEVAAALRRTQLPFAVTQIGQDAALASLEPAAEGELLARVDDLVIERAWVVSAVRQLGYEVPPTEANFFWLPLGARTSAWSDACADRKLIVRPFAGEGVRVTIGSTEENERLLAAATELVGLATDPAAM
jgi:histidinol-phosphate aminotransferase